MGEDGGEDDPFKDDGEDSDDGDDDSDGKSDWEWEPGTAQNDDI